MTYNKKDVAGDDEVVDDGLRSGEHADLEEEEDFKHFSGGKRHIDDN